MEHGITRKGQDVVHMGVNQNQFDAAWRKDAHEEVWWNIAWGGGFGRHVDDICALISHGHSNSHRQQSWHQHQHSPLE